MVRIGMRMARPVRRTRPNPQRHRAHLATETLAADGTSSGPFRRDSSWADASPTPAPLRRGITIGLRLQIQPREDLVGLDEQRRGRGHDLPVQQLPHS